VVEIREDDYPALLRLFYDGNKMPSTWRGVAEDRGGNGTGLTSYGHVVLRVRIDPDTLSDWCATHDARSSREGRRKFIAAAVHE
jgi:hypothetical protein